MRVFELENGKRSFSIVAGLNWHPLVPDKFKKQLRPLSEELESDLYVYRRSNKSMVGFAKSEDGAKAGQIPVALAIAQTLEEEAQASNALIAVEVLGEPSGAEPAFIYVMMRDGFVLSDGDAVGNEDEIRARYLDALSLSSWDFLIAPEHWMVKNAKSRDLLSFFPTKKSKLRIPQTWRLKPVNVSLKNAIMTTLLVLSLSVAGYLSYDLWKKSEEAKLRARLAAEQAAAEAEERQARLTKEPWQDLPRASVVMASCDEALVQDGTTAVNWSLGEFRCENGAFVTKWERAGGNAQVGYLKALHPSAVLSADGGSATTTTQLKISPPMGKTGEVLPASVARIDALRDMKLRYGVGVTIGPKTVPALTPKEAEQLPPGFVMPWASYEISIESKLSPQSTMAVIDAPGFRITSVSGRLSGGLINYVLKGIQYAKP